MKKVFLDNLPRKEGVGALKGTQIIDWIHSVGYKVEFIYDEIKGEVEIICFCNGNLIIKYLDKTNYKISIRSFTNCRLGKLLGVLTNEFKIEIGSNLKDNNRNLVIIDREYRKGKGKKSGNPKYYKYKCNICGWNEGWKSESSLLYGIGCSCCCGRVVVEGINDISTTEPWMVKYFQGGYDEAKSYSRTSKEIIYPVCPDCGRIKINPMRIDSIYRYKSINCICGDVISYPEKFMFNLLEQLKIEFEYQYSPQWIKPKKYDFYFRIRDDKYIIEADGEWHKIDNNLSGKRKEESIQIDKYKDQLAIEHNIEIIRIDCSMSEMDYIKNNIIISKLSAILDLSNIDWYRAEESALSNLVKKACEIKFKNPDMTTKDIGEIMNLNRFTIRRYLGKGTQIWDWCNYNAKEEKTKSAIQSAIKVGKMNGKPVELFKDGVSLGVFESGTELARQSEKVLGIKLYQRYINAVCLGKIKSYKGFTLKYIEMI